MTHQLLRKTFLAQQQDDAEYWMIIEWHPEFRIDGEIYGFASSNELLVKTQLKNLHTGKLVDVKNEGLVKRGNVVIASGDKNFLELEIIQLRDVANQIDLTKEAPAKDNVSDSDAEDFQGSDSEWNPNTSDCGSDDAINHKPKLSISTKRKRGENPLKIRNYKKTTTKMSTRSKPTTQNNTSQYQGRREENISEINNIAAIAKSNLNQTCTVNDFDKILNDSKQRLITGFKNLASTEVTSKIQGPPMTFDQQTQTNASNTDDQTLNILLENQKLLRTEMMNLYITLDDLKNQMHRMQNTMNVLQTLNNKYKDVLTSYNIVEKNPNGTINPYECNITVEENTSKNMNNTVLRASNSLNDSVNGTHPKSNYSYDTSTPMSINKYGLNVSNACSAKETIDLMVDSNDMVSIGSGKTDIPKHIFSQIKWNSYSSATRKLLMAVFPRRTLATHSLTGKASPAFNSRPPKLQLDAKKISDIIITVTQMCNVPENLVRTVITTKCSDENKMYKLRQKKMKNKNSREGDANQENELPEEPAESSSELYKANNGK